MCWGRGELKLVLQNKTLKLPSERIDHRRKVVKSRDESFQFGKTIFVYANRLGRAGSSHKFLTGERVVALDFSGGYPPAHLRGKCNSSRLTNPISSGFEAGTSRPSSILSTILVNSC